MITHLTFLLFPTLFSVRFSISTLTSSNLSKISSSSSYFSSSANTICTFWFSSPVRCNLEMHVLITKIPQTAARPDFEGTPGDDVLTPGQEGVTNNRLNDGALPRTLASNTDDGWEKVCEAWVSPCCCILQLAQTSCQDLQCLRHGGAGLG